MRTACISIVPVREVSWSVGDVIRKLRIAAGWRIKDLSAKTGNMDKTVINKLEMGITKEAKRETLAKLAQAFGLTVREMEDLIPGGVVRLDVPEPLPRRASASKTTPAAAKKRAS